MKASSVTMRAASAALLILAMSSPATHASGSHFRFHSDEQPDGFRFSLEIRGRSDDGYINVEWTGGPENPPQRNPYHVEMNRAQGRLHVRPRSHDGQAWFELDVFGERGTLVFDGRRMGGNADWEIW